MKKLLVIFLFLISISGCALKDKDSVNYTYDVVCKDVDMSKYEGVNSVNNCFKAITTKELYNVIEKKSSGLFLIARESCGCCQNIVKYINNIALDLNATIYYIDVYSEDDPLVIEVDGKMKYSDSGRKLEEFLQPILEKNENGDKKLLTPHLFSVINGVYVGNQICTDFFDFDWQNTTQKDVDNLIKEYTKVIEPFRNN